MQLALGCRPPGRGGRRKRAGRKPIGRRAGVPHRARPFHDKAHPEHVTWRFVNGLPSLRRRDLAGAIGCTIRELTRSHARRRTSFRVIHFSIQPNHVHLIVEAGSKVTLMAALRGLGIWLARRVNERLGRHGQVLGDRYHARPLTTPREMRHAIVYVLQNHRHHQASRFLVDENGSGSWFDGWEQPLPQPPTSSPVARPVTWLARRGWRRYGPIGFDEAPS